MLVTCFAATAVALWISVGVAWAVENRLFAEPLKVWKRQSKLRKSLLVGVLACAVAFAGTKPGSTDGGDADTGGSATNDVTQVEGDAVNTNDVGFADGDTNGVGDVVLNAPLPTSGGAASSGGCGLLGATSLVNAAGIAPGASAAGFSFQRMGTNEVFDFAPPEGAVVATNWLLHGAAMDRQRLVFDDWAFPFGGGNVTSLCAYACGEVRPAGADTNLWLRPFAASLGIVPAANWHLLPPPSGQSNNRTIEQSNNQTIEQSNISPSLFWHQLTPSNTLLLTWQNALLGRDTNNPVSFQAELKPSGGFAFRYDLSRLPSDELLTNATIGVQADGTAFSGLPAADLTSLTFQTADEQACDAFRDEFAAKVGDSDPYDFPPDSTNTVLEHLFYSGTTNGAFAYPQSTDGSAVLMISVSGSGSGELMVGTTFVPLVGRPAPLMAPRLLAAPPASPNPLCIEVPRGVTCPVYMRGDGTLSVSYSSEDFAFGELPDLSGRHFRGWINFPYVKATEPCIHDYTARQKTVSLPVGEGAGELKCTWHGSAQIGVENRPPRSALLTGHFSGKTTTPVSYTLSHPKYLFGKATFTQTAHYCPPPPEEEKDEDEEGESGEPTHGDDGGGGHETGGGGGDGGGGGNDGPYEPSGGERHWWDEPAPDDDMPGDEPTAPDDDPDEPSPGYEPDEEDPDEDDEDEARASCQMLRDVLKLRDPIEYSEPIRLVVPDEHRNCCPCPDHASNWVAVVYQSRRLVVVESESEVPFSRSGESLSVKVAGVEPSCKVGDAEIAFGVNGEVVKQGKYTVLGVGIESGYVPNVGTVDLRALNAFSPAFGLPVPVGTNAVDSSTLRLKARVRLTGGNVCVGLEDVTGDFAVRYYDQDEGDWRVLADATTPSRSFSYSHWRRAACDSSEDPVATVCVESSSEGSATLVFRYWNVVGGRFVEDEVRQRLTAVAPPARVDVDRDDDIDATDAQGLANGKSFRFWYNEDSDKGDYIGQLSDARPNWETDPNQARVKGKLDLINLFPVQIDVSAFRSAWGNSATFRLYDHSGLLRYCRLSGVSPDEAGSIQTSAVETQDHEPLESAALHSFDPVGVEIDDWLDENGKAMLAVMAGGPVESWNALELVVSLGDREVFRYRLPLQITSVDDMYRYLNLRGVESNPSFVPTMPGMPTNYPDDETDGRHFVFVHGYNVNADQSRDWARAMFKRLWWAGLKSKFTAVDWFGDDSQIPVPVVGDVSPNYYQNVVHAFRTAPALKAACDMLQGDKVMLSHSLGNMVVSAAAKDFGLQYAKYYLLNAAVPMEAYDSSASASAMIDGEWSNVPASFRAANWHGLFAGTDDFRTTLTWKGRFAGIANAVNCYSPTEDVLGNPADGQLTLVGGAWKIQELTKGTTLWNDINVGTFGTQRVSCEGGWGINTRYALDPTWYIYQYGFLMRAQTMTRQMAIEHPPFTPFRTEEDAMHSTNSFVIVDAGYAASLKAKFLADAIPAESFAAGANELRAETGIVSYNYQSATPNGWPRTTGVWLHSDLKDVAYFYVWKLFEKIRKGE